jgi:hypothetical protein
MRPHAAACHRLTGLDLLRLQASPRSLAPGRGADCREPSDRLNVRLPHGSHRAYRFRRGHIIHPADGGVCPRCRREMSWVACRNSCREWSTAGDWRLSLVAVIIISLIAPRSASNAGYRPRFVFGTAFAVKVPTARK